MFTNQTVKLLWKPGNKYIITSLFLNFENRYLTKSGGIVWLSWTSMPINSEKLVYAIAKTSLIKRMEEERNLLLANLTQIVITYLFYRKTSHDLKSLLITCFSVFSLIDVSKINDPETLELIDILKLTSENLKETLNNSIDELIENENINTQVKKLI